MIRTKNNNNNNRNNDDDNETDDNDHDHDHDSNYKWKIKTRVVPIVIKTLGTIPKGLVGHLESISVNLDVAHIQTTASLGTARILRRVLDY